MKNTFCFVLILISFISCKTSKPISKVIYDQRTLKLDIVFYLDKSDFSYKFSFFNYSMDTLTIVTPDIYNSFCNFKLINEQNIISNRRCVLINIDGIAWLQLLPQKKVTINSTINLRRYFCAINSSDLLAFIYQGHYKVNNSNTSSRFNFEIQPTPISKLDSIKISKILF